MLKNKFRMKYMMKHLIKKDIIGFLDLLIVERLLGGEIMLRKINIIFLRIMILRIIMANIIYGLMNSKDN